MAMRSEENSNNTNWWLVEKDLAKKAKGKPRTLNSHDSKNVAYCAEFTHNLLEGQGLAASHTNHWEMTIPYRSKQEKDVPESTKNPKHRGSKSRR